jgi:DNA-binding IclR family transcriptional regulator
MLNTVKKVGPVLELFTPEHPEWRMIDIAHALSMPKSSVHSLVTTMADIGLLSAGSRGRYRLGWMLLTLSDRMRVTMDFRSHVLPVMQDLAAELRETVLLAVMDRDQVLYIERAEGSHPTVRLAGVRVGARLPAHCAGVGKVMLADRDPAEVRAIVARAGMKRFTTRTLTTIEALEEELAQVRVRGAAYDDGEISPDVNCVAVPVRDRYGAVVAGMSVSVPAYRFPPRRDKVHEGLLRAAATATERLAETQSGDTDPARPAAAGGPVDPFVATEAART